MKKILVVFFLFPSFYFLNAQVDNSSAEDGGHSLISAVTESKNSYVIHKNKLHVNETMYYSYADQVY